MDKIVYILIFRSLDGEREDKTFELKFIKHSL